MPLTCEGGRSALTEVAGQRRRARARLERPWGPPDGRNDPVGGRAISFTLGSGAGAQTRTGTTDAAGQASRTIAGVNQPLGPGTVGGSFAGDSLYLPSSETKPSLLFAFVPGSGGGAFVVGDRAASGSVMFWGAKWSRENPLSQGVAPSAFGGFALSTANPSCGGTWATDPGNSAPPPEGPLPAYMGVLVTSSISTTGSQISGNTVGIVVVKTDSGYDTNLGHPGTGTVVARVC